MILTDSPPPSQRTMLNTPIEGEEKEEWKGRRREKGEIESGIYQSPAEAVWRGTWWRQGGVTPSDFLWAHTIVPHWWSGHHLLLLLPLFKGKNRCTALSWFQRKKGGNKREGIHCTSFKKNNTDVEKEPAFSKHSPELSWHWGAVQLAHSGEGGRLQIQLCDDSCV